MSVINSQPLIGASGQGGGYNIDRSLRFRSSASASLTRTPSSSGSQTTYTYSAWVKRGTLSSSNYVVLWSSEASGANYTSLVYYADAFYWATNGTVLTSAAVYRDVSAWYHIVLSVDTTQATASNRVKIYVNGTQVTLSGSYPTLNQALQINTASFTGKIGFSLGFGTYFDGYMAEFNFIDGQALTPSSFGETSTSTGVWIPKKYTGTYGTNGFYLDFKDNSALTTSSNAGLGKDNSGNGNYWTTNNISITSGATYDSMTDVPTLTSATAANYAVLNPLDKGGNITLSAANLNYSTGATNMVRATMQIPNTGKWYWECTQTSANAEQFGIATATASTGTYLGGDANGWSYGGSGNKFNNNTSTAYGASFTNGDVIGVAFDADAGTLVFYKNNTSQGTAFSSLTGSYFPAGGGNLSSAAINFGQRPFAYTPPTGFVALNTFNLPTPTIGATASSQANKYFGVGTYTGTGSATAVPVVGADTPDFVWIKGRSGASSHSLLDKLRDAADPFSLRLYSNATNAEYDYGSSLLTPTSTGFNLTTTDADHNTNTGTYVAWSWKANGAGSTNTAGSITSTVSANTTAGFSIVTYTGTGSNATVGHGLGVAPKMLIVKNRNDTNVWVVYHANLTSASFFLQLASTAAQTSNTTVWNATAPTSTVFSIGTNGATNQSAAQTYVAYCFSEVAGYSKFGSYTGNGSTDGVFVFLGFRPRYVMWKRTDSASGNGWYVLDSARSTYNVAGERLFPNLSNAGSVDTQVDFLSNGFKLRTTDTDSNANGGTYIFMAFAESPFRYANAR